MPLLKHPLWLSKFSHLRIQVFTSLVFRLRVVPHFSSGIAGGNVFMFADDTTIYTIGKDINNIILKLQCILDQVYTWCQSNRLIAHESKTEAMIISSQNFIGPLPRLTYGNSTIKYKQSSKCLGLIIDNKLSWQEHIKNVCKSFSNN